MIRAFAALNLPTAPRAYLRGLIQQWQAALPRSAVRWVRPDALHLTLKFYGEIPAEQVPKLKTVIAPSTRLAPLTVHLRHVGAFPNLNRPRVVWVGLAGAVEALGALQQSVEVASTSLGFVPEARAFAPHLTVGRVSPTARPADLAKLKEVISTTQLLPITFTLNALSLMQSDLRPEGAVYTELWSLVLQI